MGDTTTQAAWVKQVLARYEGPLLRYVVRFVGDADAARDVVQDTFLRLCRADRSKVEPHLAQWLYTVSRNRALDVVRREKRVEALAQNQQPGDVGVAPVAPAAIDRQRGADRASKLLAELPEAQQEVVRLKFQGGLSYKEISSITGHSVSHVGVILHKAIRSVRERWLEDEAVVRATGSKS